MTDRTSTRAESTLGMGMAECALNDFLHAIVKVIGRDPYRFGIKRGGEPWRAAKIGMVGLCRLISGWVHGSLREVNGAHSSGLYALLSIVRRIPRSPSVPRGQRSQDQRCRPSFALNLVFADRDDSRIPAGGPEDSLATNGFSVVRKLVPVVV